MEEMPVLVVLRDFIKTRINKLAANHAYQDNIKMIGHAITGANHVYRDNTKMRLNKLAANHAYWVGTKTKMVKFLAKTLHPV
tara:strand:+ start:368 stop:613 length:246 start_codon:yes stop_codon:yes gene_type:complete